MCGSLKDGEGMLLNGTKCLQATSMDRIFCWAEKNFRALSSVMSVTWKRLYCKISSWLKKGETIFLLWIVERGEVAKYEEGKKHALFLLQRTTGFINVVGDGHGDERPDRCATRPEYRQLSACREVSVASCLALGGSDAGGWRFMWSPAGCEISHVLPCPTVNVRVWQVPVSPSAPYLWNKSEASFSLRALFLEFKLPGESHAHTCVMLGVALVGLPDWLRLLLWSKQQEIHLLRSIYPNIWDYQYLLWLRSFNTWHRKGRFLIQFHSKCKWSETYI